MLELLLRPFLLTFEATTSLFFFCLTHSIHLYLCGVGVRILYKSFVGHPFFRYSWYRIVDDGVKLCRTYYIFLIGLVGFPLEVSSVRLLWQLF